MKSDNKISEEKINEILSLTSGHGKLTRLSIETLLDTNEEKDLQSFLLTRPKINSLFQQILNSLTPSEQNYLVNFDPELKSDHLEKTQLIIDGKISIPLLEAYLKEQKNNPQEAKSEKITYNPDTHEIKDGENVLSDTLTSSEYKLLKFMVENEGKILERDEIINAVWKDLSSTAGVSEQALDQLIFRVRKKIEENPNSPSHLQTIKGRGFKFTS
jgi:DNA-binding response OmpR family regulator